MADVDEVSEKTKLPPFKPSEDWIQRALEIPMEIKNEKFKKLVDHVKFTFDAFDDTGEIDYNKLTRNMSYYMGHIYTNYSLLLMQEEYKLAEYEQELRRIRAITLNDLKMSKIKYDVDAKGLYYLMEGNEEYGKISLKVNKQKAMIEFMKRLVTQIGYYGNNCKILIEKKKHEMQFGYM